jgi:guanylate kinase
MTELEQKDLYDIHIINDDREKAKNKLLDIFVHPASYDLSNKLDT